MHVSLTVQQASLPRALHGVQLPSVSREPIREQPASQRAPLWPLYALRVLRGVHSALLHMPHLREERRQLVDVLQDARQPTTH